MAQPRKLTNVLALKGAFKDNPNRLEKRINEPKPTRPLGPPPRHLNEEERLCWEEIVDLTYSGTVFYPDRLLIEHASKLLWKLRSTGWGEGTRGVDTTLYTHLMKILAALGLTPADRSRVQVLKGKEEGDSLSEFS